MSEQRAASRWCEILPPVREAAVAAGRAVQRLVEEGFETRDKGGNDPVTTADLESNRILQRLLSAVCPEAGWLSEETRDGPERLTRSKVWVIDPIDGTREFVEGIPDYAVSVALVENGQPVVGAVYNPSHDQVFTAVRDQGACCNGRPVTVSSTIGRPLRLLASRSEIRRGEFRQFENDADITPMGSAAWKLARLAAGDVDATFTLTPKNEWDIAAGVLLVQEAGGRVTDRSGQPFRFNRPQTLVDGLIAASAAAYGPVCDLIASAR